MMHLLNGGPLLYGHVEDGLLPQGDAAALGGRATTGGLLFSHFLGPRINRIGTPISYVL